MIRDIDYYNSRDFENPSGDESELHKALIHAEKLIDLVTKGKCREYENLSAPDKDRLKHAVCAQAEEYLMRGLGKNDEIDCRVKMSGFSFESRNNGGVRDLSPLAGAILKLAGLFYSE